MKMAGGVLVFPASMKDFGIDKKTLTCMNDVFLVSESNDAGTFGDDNSFQLFVPMPGNRIFA